MQALVLIALPLMAAILWVGAIMVMLTGLDRQRRRATLKKEATSPARKAPEQEP